MRITLPNGKWRKRLKIKALPPFAELHKVRAGNCKMFLRNVLSGLQIYWKILQEYGMDSQLYMTSTGAGEVYLVCKNYYNYIDFKGTRETSVFVTVCHSKANIATQLFQIQRVACVAQSEFIALLKFYVFGLPTNMEILHHHLISRHTGILMRLECLHGPDYAKMYQEAVFGELNNSKKSVPLFDTDFKRLDIIFKHNILSPGKTIVLCPYANSLVPINKAFWEKTAEVFLNFGFSVCTNSSDAVNKPAVEGTVGILIPYD